MNHIRDKLPDMKARLNTLMGQTQQELNAFGDATFLGEQHRVSSAHSCHFCLQLTSGIAHSQTHDRLLTRLRILYRWYLS